MSDMSNEEFNQKMFDFLYNNLRIVVTRDYDSPYVDFELTLNNPTTDQCSTISRESILIPKE